MVALPVVGAIVIGVDRAVGGSWLGAVVAAAGLTVGVALGEPRRTRPRHYVGVFASAFGFAWLAADLNDLHGSLGARIWPTLALSIGLTILLAAGDYVRGRRRVTHG